MKLRFLALAVVLATTVMAAQAQVGLYLNPVVTRISNSTPDTGTFAFLGSGDTSRIFGGVDFGGYYTFAPGKSFDLSADVRDSIVHANNASLNSFLVGPRLTFKSLPYGLRPYVQVSFGVGRTKPPLNSVHISKLEYDGFLGLDKTLNRHIDFRAIEVGYGSVTTTSSAIYGGRTPIPAAKLINFSTGFVFKF
jgi:hypothetical protein